jgi:hypothetical protein
MNVRWQMEGKKILFATQTIPQSVIHLSLYVQIADVSLPFSVHMRGVEHQFSRLKSTFSTTCTMSMQLHIHVLQPHHVNYVSPLLQAPTCTVHFYGLYKCKDNGEDWCDYATDSWQDLRRHVKSMEHRTCPMCPKVLVSSKLAGNFQTHNMDGIPAESVSAGHAWSVKWGIELSAVITRLLAVSVLICMSATGH